MTTLPETMLTGGERLRIARERSGTKVGDMAEMLGRSRNRITAYEHGVDPPMWVMKEYVTHLGNVTLEWLAAEVGPPPTETFLCPECGDVHTCKLPVSQLLLFEDEGGTIHDLRDRRSPVPAAGSPVPSGSHALAVA